MKKNNETRKKSWPKWQGKRDKSIVKGSLNILLQKYVGNEYEKDFLKEEKYILNSERFQNAVEETRKKLGFNNTEIIPEEMIQEFITRKLYRGKSLRIAVEAQEKIKQQYREIARETAKKAGISEDWSIYLEHYIINKTPPRLKTFIFPKTIWVEDINEENELLVRLKPGLRYEDYINAWQVLSRPLGKGTRLSKTRSESDLHLQMLKDKDSGMTYKEVAEKHYPKRDPLDTIDRVKKAVTRARKRLEGDK